MRHLKYFENVKTLPEIGDYVVLQDFTNYVDIFGDKFAHFVNDNVGQVYNITENHMNREFTFDVLFSNIPDDIVHLFHKKIKIEGDDDNVAVSDTWFFDDIIYLSKNKEDAELFLKTKKYNL